MLFRSSTLLSVKAQLVLSKYFKCSLKVLYMPTFLFTFHYYVIDIYFDRASYFILEHPCHHPLIRDPNIFQPKRHHGIVVVRIRGDECCLFLVLGCQGDLMIPLKGIQEAHSQVSIHGIYQLVDLRHWKRVFWTCPVQVREIYINLPLVVLFLYYHGIC